jgi:tryptophan-rich sensory protein
MPKTKKEWVALLFFLFITYIVAYTAYIFTESSVRTWYPTLLKPSFNPPNWAFPVAWSILYTLMAIAIWLVWRVPKESYLPYYLWALQLFFNFAWSYLFFGIERVDLAFKDIVLLVTFITLTILSFWKYSRVAAWLLVPYLLWVIFAAALNYQIWKLNP